MFFFTRQSLVSQDHDDNVDVYDAREDGGMAGQNPPVPARAKAKKVSRRVHNRAGARCAVEYDAEGGREPWPPPAEARAGSTKGQARTAGACTEARKGIEGMWEEAEAPANQVPGPGSDRVRRENEEGRAGGQGDERECPAMRALR